MLQISERKWVDFLFCIVLLSGTLFARTSKADFFLHPWTPLPLPLTGPGPQPSLKLETLYYTTSSNFNSSSQIVVPPELQMYARLQQDLYLGVGISERLSLFGRLSWSLFTVASSVRAGRNSGLTDQAVGFNFRISQARSMAFDDSTVNLDFQARLDFPAYNNATSELAGTPSLGDGTVDLTGGLFLSIPVWSKNKHLLKIQAGGGYTYRTLSYSAAFPWSVNLNYIHRDGGVFFNIISSGFLSLRTDPYGIIYFPRSNAGTGGSMITGDSNPSLFQIGGQFGYRTRSHLEIFLGGSQALWGQMAPYGLTLSGGVTIHLGFTPPVQPTNPAHLSAEVYGQSNQGFLKYSLQAEVLKTNDRLNLVKINKGSQDGIEAGQIFDIFEIAKNGSEIDAVARAEVTHFNSNQAVLQVLEHYRDVNIEEGFIAKRLIQEQVEKE